MTGESLVDNPWWERYRSTLAAGESHRIELFVRSLGPVPGTHHQRTALVERLETLDATGLLDGYDVTILGDGFCLCETCRETGLGGYVLDRLRRLRDWGGDQVSALAFRERTVDSAITGEAYTVLEPPTTSMAVYVDDALEAVFPCRIGDETYDIGDYLAAMTRSDPGRHLSRVDA